MLVIRLIYVCILNIGVWGEMYIDISGNVQIAGMLGGCIGLCVVGYINMKRRWYREQLLRLVMRCVIVCMIVFVCIDICVCCYISNWLLWHMLAVEYQRCLWSRCCYTLLYQYEYLVSISTHTSYSCYYRCAMITPGVYAAELSMVWMLGTDV